MATVSVSYSEAPQNNQDKVQLKPKMEKVIQGEVKIKKPSLGQKFAKTFLGGEVSDVKGYLKDWSIQALKGILLDGLSMLFFNTPTGRTGNLLRGPNVSSAFNYSYTSYNQRNNIAQSQQKQQNPTRPEYNNFIFATQAEAETVLTNMIECISQFGRVSVNDLYDMVGITAPWSDVYWGWTNLSTATTTRDFDGYHLILPKPQRINP